MSIDAHCRPGVAIPGWGHKWGHPTSPKPGCPQFLAPIKALSEYVAVKLLMYVRDQGSALLTRSMCGFVGTKSIPERILPSADEAVVIADWAVPIDAVKIVGGRVRHDDPATATSSRTPAATDAGFIVNVGRGVDDDVGEIFGEEPRTAWHIRERARWVEIVSDIDNPSVTHGQ